MAPAHRITETIGLRRGFTEEESILMGASNGQVPIVCLVDDDASVLKATSRLLASSGWKVQSFLDPIAFLRYAEASKPRVAVLDVIMPIMNGLEVQTQLRTVSPSTRVIILTSKDDPSVRSKAMAAGATGFFLKPVDDDEFLAGIEAAANGTRSR